MNAKTLLPLAVVAVFGLAALSGEAKDLAPLQSLKVTFPDSNQTFPAAPGSDVANNNCLACHSVEMVLFQPNLPRAAWEAEVAKMRNVYKAPVAEVDAATIVDYLAKLKSPQ